MPVSRGEKPCNYNGFTRETWLFHRLRLMSSATNKKSAASPPSTPSGAVQSPPEKDAILLELKGLVASYRRNGHQESSTGSVASALCMWNSMPKGTKAKIAQASSGRRTFTVRDLRELQRKVESEE